MSEQIITLNKQQEVRGIFEAVKGEPEITPEMEPYLSAFWNCNSGRIIGFGLGGIPTDEIYKYCQIMGITDQEEIQLHLYFIKMMDNRFREVSHQLSENKRQQRRR